MEIGALLWIVTLIGGFVLFAWWANRKNRQHPGDKLGDWGGRMPATKLPDPLDRYDAQ